MPLINGYSDAARSTNIETLRREGKNVKQATAIAYRIQRKAQKRAGKPLTPLPFDGRAKKRHHAGMARKKGRSRGKSSTALARVGSSSPRRHHGGGGGGGFGASVGPMGGALGAAFLLGVAKARGWEIPYLETAGEAGSLALAGFAAQKFLGVRSPLVRHATLAMAVIAVHDWASEHGGSGLTETHKGKKKETTSGENYDTAAEIR